jgi:hypothetical protein
LPFFLVAGFLFVLTEPSLLLAQVLLYGYVVWRLLHVVAYFTARTHDTRCAMDRGLDHPHLYDLLDVARRVWLSRGVDELTPLAELSFLHPVNQTARMSPSGRKRTSAGAGLMSAIDPKRKSFSSLS